MQYARKYNLGFVLGGLAAILIIGSINASAQKKLHISTNAMGTSTQLGRLVSIDIRVNSYSTADDQKALLEAFGEYGSQGLTNAVEKMSSKGRIAITGTVGYDLNYIREFKMPDGTRKIRFITDRPIAFAEHWGSTRSTDYSLSMGEVIISHKKGKSTGTLLPAAKFRLDKDKELEIETFQNPWNLTNIIIW
ncbi:MAG TPA: hypothetical protein VHQ01_08760 [Pyrinomonadaceae bacterium]|jgi:hypothetical protein|nr:hypothetical protein [Pyrinomonadaceae bacterium]